MNKYNYIALLVFAVIGMTSCAKEDAPTENNQVYLGAQTTEADYIDPNSPAVDLDLDGVLELKDDDWRTEEELRAIGFRGGKNAKFVGTGTVPMRIFLTKLGSTAVYEATISANVDRDSDTDKISIKAKPENITFTNGYGTTSNNRMTPETASQWYVAAMIGGDGGSPTNFVNRDRKTVAVPLDEPDGGYDANRLGIAVPLAANWTQLTSVSSDAAVNRGKVKLSFRMLGSVLNIKVRNKVVHDMRVDAVKLWYGGLSPFGTFSINRGTNASQIPANNATTGSFTFSAQTNGYTAKDHDFDVQKNIFMIYVKDYDGTDGAKMPAAGESGRIPIWGMPIAPPDYTSNNGDMLVELYARGEGSDIRRFAPVEQYSNLKAKVKPGTVHNITTYLKSDLMISEVFYANPVGYNLGLIELYNPTTESLDLSRYALVRVQGGTQPFYNPNLAANNDKYIQLAVTMPLVFVAGQRGDWNTSAYANPSGNWPYKTVDQEANADNAYEQRIYTFESNRPNASGLPLVHFNNSGLGAHTILSPGKTIIIASNYFVQNAGDQGTKGLLFPEVYNPINTRQRLGVGVQFYKAYEKGYLQYLVAVSNSRTLSMPNAISNQKTHQPSTNHLTDNDGVVLVKRTGVGSAKIGGVYTRIIDFNIPLPEDPHGYDAYKALVTTDPHFRTRKPGVYLGPLITPLFRSNGYMFNKPRYNENEWLRTTHKVKGNTEGEMDWWHDDPVSIGSRNYVAGAGREDIDEWDRAPEHSVPSKNWTDK